MNWPLKPLGSLCLKIGSGVTPRGGDSVYVNDGVSLIRSQNVYNGSFDMRGLAHITDEQANNMQGVEVFGGDVLLNITGDSVARSCQVPDAVLPARVNQHVSILRPKINKLSSRFLLYYLISPYMQSLMLSLAGSGGTRKALTKSMIESFNIPTPPLDVQESIASTLFAYDDLIEINNRQIQLLEEAARQLFKEWFVRLRFPGHEQVKVVNGVPEGWIKGTYGGFFDFFGGYAFKSSSYVSDGRYHVVTIKNVHDGVFITDCNSKVAAIPNDMKKHCNLSNGDILLSLTGNVGRTCIVCGNKAYLLNQRVAKIAPKLGIPITYAYWKFRDPETQKTIQSLAYGVAQLNLSPVKLAQLELVHPTKEILALFNEYTLPIFQQICTLNLSNIVLRNARDLLLPRLMSGEIRV